MFYYNLGYKYAIPEGSPHSGGSIILASAMTHPQLMRRKFRQYPHLEHRLFDPQLYLAGLDKSTAKGSVEKLATYPWFCKQSAEVPKYDSGAQKLQEWKAEASSELLKQWTGKLPSTDEEVRLAVGQAILLQLQLNVQHVILPVPLIDDPYAGFSEAARWIDVGLSICAEARISKQVFATLAIPDAILRSNATVREPLLNAATGYLASQPSLAGAYIVVEQGSEDGYVLRSFETCRAILTIVDDIVRGAGKLALINYAGAFGAVAAAAGASIWSSNFYRSLRRMKLDDFDDATGRTYPRYFSIPLMGDITPDGDLDKLAMSGTFGSVLSKSDAATLLNAALLAKRPANSIPGWVYDQSNITTATQHHNESMHRLGLHLDALDDVARVRFMHKLLRAATHRSSLLQNHQPTLDPKKSDYRHQDTWLQAFEWWMQRAGHLK